MLTNMGPNAHDPPGVLLAVGIAWSGIAIAAYVWAIISLRSREDRHLFGFGIATMSALCMTVAGAGAIFFAYTWSGYFPALSPRAYDQDLFTYIAFSVAAVGSVCSFIPAIRDYRARSRAEHLGLPIPLR